MTDKMLRQCLMALLVAAIALIYVGRYTDIDLLIADWMYDFSAGRFPWKETWFTTVFMHQWVKELSIGFVLALAASLIIDKVLDLHWYSPATRSRLYVVVLTYVAVPIIVSLLKSHSIHACPWSIDRYGGAAPYLRLFDTLPAGVVAGHCFPAGHASGVFGLAAFAIFWLPERPKAAVLAFLLGSIPGLSLGWVQQLRGAHFLTHTLWAMWITGLVFVIFARLFYSNRERIAKQVLA
jgi:membrane-associated PAP2 superfamily phosphatase